MILLSIFSFGDTYIQGSSDSTFTKLIPVIVGALIGFGSTLIMFMLAGWKERRSKKKVTKHKMIYYRALLRNSLQQIILQKTNLENAIEETKVNPHSMPVSITAITSDLERLVHKINTEEYFLAYIELFGDTDEVKEEFRLITTTVDYFYKTITDAPIVYQRFQELVMQYAHEGKSNLITVTVGSYKGNLEKLLELSSPRIIVLQTNISRIDKYKF